MFNARTDQHFISSRHFQPSLDYPLEAVASLAGDPPPAGREAQARHLPGYESRHRELSHRLGDRSL
jgi:hypothetical protein